MTDAFVAWPVSAAVLLLLAFLLGAAARRNLAGMLIDGRGRYSLTQFQLVAWTIVVLSLVSGFFWARFFDSGADALEFSIPNEVLLLLGISVGSAGLSTAIKTAKDTTVPERIAASDANDKPRLAQMFLTEEGDAADQTIDVAKYQNFWLTVILLVAYVALGINVIANAEDAGDLTALPSFSGTFLTLLGISHAGYLAGKLPNRPGTPPGLSVALRRAGAVPGAAAAVAAPPTYAPRNPS